MSQEDSQELASIIEELRQQLTSMLQLLKQSQKTADEALQKAEKEKRRANQNEGYRKLFEDRVNRQAKDSVFTDLFSRPKYQMKLYRELFPEDKDISSNDLELCTIDRVLTNHPYNDLGILVRDRLIVLAEAQTSWSDNIVWRMLCYWCDTVEQYLRRRDMSAHRIGRVRLPDVQAFVVYPGTGGPKSNTISLRETFFDSKPDRPDFTAKVLRGGGGPDSIVSQYVGFCHVLDTQRTAHANDVSPEGWIDATIEECKQKGYLAEYLTERRDEVKNIMLEMYDPEVVAEMERKSDIFEAEIAFGRMAGLSDETIRDLLVKRHGLLPEYAQNLLDAEPEEYTFPLV